MCIYRSLISVCVWNEVRNLTWLQNLMDFSFWIAFQVDQFPHSIQLVTKVLCKGI